MGLLAKCGVMIGPTDAGSPAGISETLGWRPKCVLFFSNYSNAVGESSNFDMCIGFAVDDTPTQRQHRCILIHGSDPTDGHQNQSANCFFLPDASSGGNSWTGNCAFSATGFTVTFSNANTPIDNPKVVWLALGGDIQVKGGSSTIPTGTGGFSVTGAGFQPVAGLFFGGQQTGISGTSTGDGVLCFGMVDAAGAQGVVALNLDGNEATTDSYRVYKTDKMYAQLSNAGAVRAEAGFTSWDTDGFTLDLTTASGSAWRYSYLLIGNCEAELEHLTNPTSGSPPVAETLGPYASSVLAAIFAGCSTTNAGTVQAGAAMELGVSSAGLPGAHVYAWDQDGAAAANCAHGLDDDAAIRHTDMSSFAADNVASATPQTDTSKETDLSWTSLDTGAAVRYMALSLGSKAVAAKTQCVSN